MSKRWLSGGVMALVLALCMLAPAAVQGDEQEPSVEPSAFRLQASNGYEVILFAAGFAGEGEGDAALWALSRRALAAYHVPATLTRSTIEADLGELGKVSVKAVPTGRTKSVRVGCTGKKRVRVAEVRYEGTIEFHGEEGFTEVSATSARRDYEIVRRVGCSIAATTRSESRPLPGARLAIDRFSETDELELSATKNRPGSRTAVSVEVDELRGEMEIERAAWTLAGAGALRFDPRLREATLSPPAPFAGHATFRRHARPANRWTGNLTVDLPGRSNVPLTGRDFYVTLEHPRTY